MRVVRFNLPGKEKQFRPFHPVQDGWAMGDPAGPLPLYRLDALPDKGIVWVCEGEKAADAAAELRLPAVTSAHGAASAPKSDWSPLAGREVVILPDHDDPGERYALEAARLLLSLEPPARVRIVRLPGLPEGGDIVEFVEARPGVSPQTVREEITSLAEQAQPVPAAEVLDGPVTIRLADVAPEPVRWLWEKRIALGKVTMISGDPGLGKSFLTMDLAARITRGDRMPDGTPAPRGPVVLLNAEDDLADTVRPRMDAAGADVGRVIVLDAIKVRDDTGKPVQRSVNLSDVPYLERVLQATPDVQLVIIDPVSAYVSDVDSNNNADVRGLLAPLARLAGKYRVAIVMVSHLNKASGGKAIYRTTGSLGFVAAARAAFVVAKDSGDETRRLFLPLKNNLGNDRDGLAFRIVDGRLEWEEGPVTDKADDVLGEAGDVDNRREQRDDALEFLRETLRNGALPVEEIRQFAKAAGLSWATVRRAKGELDVEAFKTSGDGPWAWRLPAAAPVPPAPPPLLSKK